MKQVLVGSVYAPSPRNKRWYELQRLYLDETLGRDNYTLALWLNRTNSADFDGATLVGQSSRPSSAAYNEHALGLAGLLEYFAKDEDHEHFLILDSDAFPVRTNWLPKLLDWMKADHFLPERLWASPVRMENLDTFPHPCVIFIKGEFLRSFDNPCEYFDFTPGPHKNLSGFSFDDVGCQLNPELNGLQIWQPMIRTNVWNPHPVLSAVYGGLFYHHGAGSRPLDVRAIFLRAFDTFIPHYGHTEMEQSLYKEVSMNPKMFIQQLAGGE